jgi:spore germination protein GerM
MNAQDRQQYVKKALLGLWAMLTLILLVALGLLVLNMVQQGRSPFPAPPPSEAAAGAQAQAETQETLEQMRESPLYFASEDARLLVPERRRLTLGDDTIANLHTALEALFDGPDGVLTPVAPPTSRVNGIFLMGNGELIVDLSMEVVSALRRQPSVSSEMLFLQGIVHTLSAPELLGSDAVPVSKIRFLIEGASAEESFQDAHCDWASPIARDPQWLAGNQPPDQGNG